MEPNRRALEIEAASLRGVWRARRVAAVRRSSARRRNAGMLRRHRQRRFERIAATRSRGPQPASRQAGSPAPGNLIRRRRAPSLRQPEATVRATKRCTNRPARRRRAPPEPSASVSGRTRAERASCARAPQHRRHRSMPKSKTESEISRRRRDSARILFEKSPDRRRLAARASERPDPFPPPTERAGQRADEAWGAELRSIAGAGPSSGVARCRGAMGTSSNCRPRAGAGAAAHAGHRSRRGTQRAPAATAPIRSSALRMLGCELAYENRR